MNGGCWTCGRPLGEHKGEHAYELGVVDDFRGEYRFLSNFHLCAVQVHGWTFPSSEHAYQAMKAADPAADWPRFLAGAPRDAKKLGKAIRLRTDWEAVKVVVMRAVVWDKFARNPELRSGLMSTGRARLIEMNTWQDRFWGVCNGEGENWLGRILMETRDGMWHIDSNVSPF